MSIYDDISTVTISVESSDVTCCTDTDDVAAIENRSEGTDRRTSATDSSPDSAAREVQLSCNAVGVDEDAGATTTQRVAGSSGLPTLSFVDEIPSRDKRTSSGTEAVVVNENVRCSRFASAGAFYHHAGGMDVDDRKRPLSISSTSSSASSTSSLPRHQRKKIATVAVANAGGGGGVGEQRVDVGVSPVELLTTVNEYSPAAEPQSAIERRRFFYQDCSWRRPTTIDVERVRDAAAGVDVSPSPCRRYNAQVSEDYLEAGMDDAEELSRADDDDAGARESRNPSGSSDEILSGGGGRPSDGVSCPLTGLLYIDRVVTEILETERIYVKDLHDIVEVLFKIYSFSSVIFQISYTF